MVKSIFKNKEYLNSINNLKQIQISINTEHNNIDNCLMYQFIKPFCIKYHLMFRSGMGSYKFRRQITGKQLNVYDNRINKKTTFWNEYRKLKSDIIHINDMTNFLSNGYDYIPPQ